MTDFQVIELYSCSHSEFQSRFSWFQPTNKGQKRTPGIFMCCKAQKAEISIVHEASLSLLKLRLPTYIDIRMEAKQSYTGMH